MKKRIVISESEKERILSQHKNVIKEESELKRQSLSEREMSKLINNVLINEGNTVKEAVGCKSNTDCKFPQKCINGKCETTTALKEMKQCKSDTDCPSNMACYNGRCQSTTSAKEMKEAKKCRPGEMECSGGCCPRGSFCRLGMCTSGISQPTMPQPPMNEELDEIIYEIEMDVEEIDETIYEIEMDEEEVETNEETGKIGCCRSSAKSCGPGFYCMCPSGVCKKVMPIRV